MMRRASPQSRCREARSRCQARTKSSSSSSSKPMLLQVTVISNSRSCISTFHRVVPLPYNPRQAG